MKKTGSGANESDGAGRQEDASGDALYFDDVPLEDILYSSGPRRPGAAGLYLRGREPVNAFVRAALGRDHADAARLALRIVKLKAALSVPMYIDAVRACCALIPPYPLAILRYEFSPIVALLHKAWRFAVEEGHSDLQEIAANPYSRCQEMVGNYEASRKALLQLREIHRNRGDLEQEAAALNNYAFTYWAESRYEEALPGFEEAVEKFQASGAYFRVPNARANYWDCRVQVDAEADLDEAERVAHELMKALHRSFFWQRRKPFLLLSRVRNRQGKLRAAIRMARKVCAISENQSSGLAGLDCEWLFFLQARDPNPGGTPDSSIEFIDLRAPGRSPRRLAPRS